MKILALFCLFISFSVIAQENPENYVEPFPIKKEAPAKSPKLAALLGVVPGLGQAYVGNYYTAAGQSLLFIGLYDAERNFRRQPDYIKFKDRDVKFNLEDAVVGYELQKNGWVYNDLPYRAAVRSNEKYQDLDYPLFSETNFDRDMRLWKEKKLAEENTLLKYGEYSRSSRNTVNADTLNNPILSTMMYSIYSSYRDAGGIGEERKSETINELAYSPFNYKVLRKPEVGMAIAVLAAFIGFGANSGDPILVPTSVKRDGSLYGKAFIDGMSPGIGEEAFFRGYLNHSLSTSYGPVAGIGTSSVLFMLAHEGNEDARDGRLARFLAGVYFGWIHYRNGYDIRPSIAVHFWNNFFIGLAMMSQYKADPNYDKGQRDVYFMPIQFTFSM